MPLILAEEITVMDGKRFVFTREIVSWNSFIDFIVANPIIACLVCFMILDIISGLGAAAIKGKMSSSASFKGMMGKGMIMGMVATARLFEFIVPGMPWGQFMALFFCITEVISITENAAKCGVPIPRQWTEVLEKVREARENQQRPAVNVEMRTEIHTDKKDVQVTTIQEPQEGIPGLQPKVDKTPSDQFKTKTVVKMTDSQVLSPDDLSTSK